MHLSEAFVIVVRLAELLGVSHINKLPGLWRCQIDDHWSIAINAKEAAIESIPTHHMSVEYNGWPAALLNPFQGAFVISEHVNEDTFIAAVKARIAKEENTKAMSA